MCGPGGCAFGPWGWIMMLAMVVFWLLFIGGIIALVVWALRAYGPSSRSTETPMDILNKRYARGEITQEEYERMKREVSER